MAPFLSLVALFASALFTTVSASPHVARDVHEHVHVHRSPVHVDSFSPPHRRSPSSCIPRPSNSTLALPSTAPVSTPTVSSNPSSPAPAPQPTSSYAQSPSTPPSSTTSSPPFATASSSAAPAQTNSPTNSDEPSYMHGMHSGQGTFFAPDLGACGYTNGNSDYIVAVSHLLYDSYPGADLSNPNNNPVCGKSINVYYENQSVLVKVVDRCTGCDELSLDFSPSAFLALAPLAFGRIDINWEWN